MVTKTIKSVEKAIDLLFLFDGDRTDMDVKTIAHSLGVPLRTTYRLVDTLRKRRVLVLDESTGRYRVSPRVGHLLAAIEDSGNITRLCGPFLTELARRSGETAQLFVPSSDEALLIETAESPHPLRVGPRMGQRIPLHCGAGAKVLLAFRPPEEWDGYIHRNGLKKYTPNTVTNPETLKRQLQTIRRTGFAESNQEFVLGVRALGAPIKNGIGVVCASLGLVGPDTRLTMGKARKLKSLMIEVAGRISAALAGDSSS